MWRVVYRIGPMAHTIHGITLLNRRLALFSHLLDNTGEIATNSPTNGAVFRCMVEIGGIEGESDCFDLDIIWWRRLFLDMGNGRNTMFLDDKGFHGC